MSTTTVKSLTSYFEDYVNDTPEEAAKKIVATAPVSVFIPLVRETFAHWQRSQTRQVERDLAQALHDAQVEELPPTKPGRAARRYVKSPVAVDRHLGLLGRKFFDGERYVLYADATIEDLDRRIAYLEGQAADLQASIDFAKRLRRTMVRAKVTKLGDIKADALADIWAQMKDEGDIA